MFIRVMIAVFVAGFLAISNAFAAENPFCSLQDVQELQSNLVSFKKLRDDGVVSLITYLEHERVVFYAERCAGLIPREEYCEKILGNWKQHRAVVDAYPDQVFRIKEIEKIIVNLYQLKAVCDFPKS